MTGAPSSTRRALSLGAIAILVVLGTVLAAIGAPIWLLVLATGLALTVALGQLLSWTSAAVATLAILLIGLVSVMRLLPLTGAPIAVVLIAALSIVGLACSAALLVRRAVVRLPDPASLALVAHALPVPAAAGALAAVIAVVSGGTRLSWGMNNDAATNTMLARYMWESGGLDTTAHPNASPLAQTLIVAVSAPGRDALLPGELLAHDLARNAQLWIAVVLIASLAAGLLVARAVRDQSSAVRLVAAALGALIPLTWYVTGISFQFGFMNAPLVVALLAALWLVWTDVPRAPLVSLGILALLATTLLAIWAPLAILPLALGAAVCLSRRTRLWRESTRGERLWGIATGTQLVAYVALVTVPDFLASSGGLGLDGGMANMTPSGIAVAGSTALLVGVVGWSQRLQGHVLQGLVVVLAASVVAVGYLVVQRRGADDLWGYYPAKFAWFVSILLIVVVLATIVSWAAGGRRLVTLALLVTAAVASLGLLGQVAPSRATLDVARAAVDLRPGAPAGSVDAAVVDLVAISDPTTRDLASRLGDHDRFINYWLIHMTTPAEDDPIRMFGYVGDPDNLSEVCHAITTWGGGVTVHTRDAGLQASLSAVCSADFDVELVP
jgi:hypothetical protein